ncbi:MAG TPA: NAD-dependent epimerase/dehydratase family protein [Actinomycetota bacterium]
MPADVVLVSGGSGQLGRALVRRLVADGRVVRALARSERATAIVAEAGATPVPGDVLDPGSLRPAMEGVGTVFHAAGVNATCLRDPAPLYRVNVDGSTNVIGAAAEEGVGCVVYTSSAAAIGEAEGTIGREDSPHRGSYLSHYERSKRLAERKVLDLAGELGLRVVSVNPSSVQGPGRMGGSARLLLDAVNGRLPGMVDTVISLVDVDDCTQGHLLAEAKGAAGERYLLSGATVTTRDAVELLRRVWGRPERVRWFPRWLATGAGALVEAGAILLRRDPPVCREAIRTLLHGHRYDGSRAERELGLRYTPLEETLRQTLSWYAERGLAPPPRRAGT